jgi:hypothetical protein
MENISQFRDNAFDRLIAARNIKGDRSRPRKIYCERSDELWPENADVQQQH